MFSFQSSEHFYIGSQFENEAVHLTNGDYYGGILDLRSDNFSYFCLQVTLMLPTKFLVNWPLGSEEAQNIF